MFNFIRKSLLHSRNGYTVEAHKSSSMAVSLSLRYLSSNADANPHSFTVSYLVKSCGLSYESALIASKKVQFETLEKPNSILSFFEKLGFSNPQISTMVRKYPAMLNCNPGKIFPKVEFLHSKLASVPDLIRILTGYPWLLKQSLKNRIVVCFDLLAEALQSEREAIEVIKRNARVLSCHPEAGLLPNINILRENGVSISNIRFLALRNLQRNSEQYRKIVENVKEMGFDPLKSQFVIAIGVLASMNKSKWDRKVEVYKTCGWSDEDVLTAFKRYPWCMVTSEDKIIGVMDFYVNKLGFESSAIVNRPQLLSLSLKKRLIPRAAVFQLLLSKGVVKLDSSMISGFSCTEKQFLEKYVNCHEEAPFLIKLYNEAISEGGITKS